MRPVAVQMQAFGPFAGLQVVDFRCLGSKTFFLIHGPTGSGKTTILDAMCFALFGDSSGGEREGRQMRSHHADAETLTEVRFDFSLGGQHYRVHRIPEQMRKAKRGGGETKQPQVAELFNLEDQNGQVVERAIESGWSKVTVEVEKLLGFKSGQFRQVIMLPQGKFSEFLRSSSQDREKILQVLFGTELYKRIEEQLSRVVADVAQKAAILNTQRQTLLGQLNAADEVALEAQLVQKAEDLTQRSAALESAAATATAAEAQWTQAQRAAACFQELDQAVQALQALKGQEPEWTRRRTQLASARQAAAVRPHVDALQLLDKQLAQERARLEALRRDLDVAGKTQVLAQQAVERERLRAPELEQTIGRLAQLEALEGKVLALDAARKDLIVANASAKQRQADQVKADKDFKVATEAQKQLAIEVQANQVLVAGLDGLRAQHVRLSQQLEHVAALSKLTSELATSKRQLEAKATTVKAAEQSLANVRQSRQAVYEAWIAGQAARLAHTLSDGQACPVCGAHDHPAPAHVGGELVLDDTLKAAEDSLAGCEGVLREAERQSAEAQKIHFGVESRIAGIQAAMAGAQETPEALRALCEAAHVGLKKAEVAALALKPLEGRLAQASVDLTRLEAVAKDALTQANEALGRQQQFDAVVKERQADVPLDLTDAAKLNAAQSAAVAARDALKKSHDQAVEAANVAGAALAHVQGMKHGAEQVESGLVVQQSAKAKEVAERLVVAGFADIDVYQAACLEEAQLLELETTLQAFDANVAAAAQRHERASGDTRDLVRPDLTAAQARHEAAKAAHLAASNAVRDALAAHQTTKTLMESLRLLAGEYQTLQARYSLVKKVADVAAGNNEQRMSFQRYVLATLLEEVLVATTLRLRVMSRGRYEIRRKLQPADLRSAAGLDLEVFDQYTGMTRAVTTLSGGESFLASLALALGLSDVVQSYAGGIRLDAIFVDEGFGTLDPEALDFAVRALKDLQQAGRLVGIISHVAELREWIDARLELKTGQSGSVAEFVV